jgi:hypothetical protein
MCRRGSQYDQSGMVDIGIWHRCETSIWIVICRGRIREEHHSVVAEHCITRCRMTSIKPSRLAIGGCISSNNPMSQPSRRSTWASFGTIARAAGVSIGSPVATKSFCISTTIIAVFAGSIALICIVRSPVDDSEIRIRRGSTLVFFCVRPEPDPGPFLCPWSPGPGKVPSTNCRHRSGSQSASGSRTRDYSSRRNR